MKPSLADLLKVVIDAGGVIAAQALIELVTIGLEETFPGALSKDNPGRHMETMTQWAKEIGVII